jgi:predicted outer membrane repeat protein
VYGGAIWGADFSVTGARFTGNTAAEGGAVSALGEVTITRSAFRGNSASRYGGAIENSDYIFRSVLTLRSSILRGNSAGLEGGGIYSQPGGGTAVIMTSSRVRRNQPGNCFPAHTITGCPD